MAVAETGLTLKPDAEPFPGYRLKQRIGRGGFAEVWEACSPSGTPIALKFMHITDPHASALEVRGIQSMKKLRHPFLLYLHQVWTIPGYIVVSMELADGSLDDLLRASFAEFGTAVEPLLLCRYLGQAAKAIDFLNTRHHTVDGQRVSFQHGDIKPNNILICEGDVAKLADFGTAVPMAGARILRTPVGTLEYAPPEVFQSELTDRSDQFSFAVTYCLLRGGKLPFTDTPPSFGAPCPRYNHDLSMLP